MTSRFLLWRVYTLLLQTRLSFLGSLVTISDPELGECMDFYRLATISAEICTGQGHPDVECMTCRFANGVESVVRSSACTVMYHIGFLH